MFIIKHFFTILLLSLFCINIINAQVGHATFSFNDPNRANRLVEGHVYYPATAAGNNTPIATGQFPLIVFGHGFVMAWSEYSVWWENIVPEGYIMVFPTTEGSFSPDHGAFGEDISFLVDTYAAENNNSSSFFFQKFNGKSTVMGHSMGGGASFLAAAMNPNVTAHLSLAAAETTPSAIGAAATINIPSLVIASGRDCVAPPADHQLPLYNALTSPYKAYIEITDGNHCNYGISSFGSNCVLGETFTFCNGFISQTSQHMQMIDASLPWLDYWLQCDCAAWDTFHNYLSTTSSHTYQEEGSAPINYPTNAMTSNITSNSATVDWDAVDGTVQYTITYCVQNTTNCSSLTTSMTTIDLTGLAEDTVYEYQISADCGSGNANAAPTQTFMTTASACVPILNISNSINSGTYNASVQIISNGQVNNPENVTFQAGNCIDLNTPFEVQIGATFLAEIVPCSPIGNQSENQ